MDERKVSVSTCCLIAYGLWVAAVALIVVAAMTSTRWVGWFGLATSAAAATATVRMYLIRQYRLISAAYRLGQDSVTSMR